MGQSSKREEQRLSRVVDGSSSPFVSPTMSQAGRLYRPLGAAQTRDCITKDEAMLKWLLRKRIDAFERANNYDMAYARAMLEANPRALIRFSRAAELGQYRGPLPEHVWHAVKLVAAEHEDCGPCLQLGVTLAQRAGIADDLIARTIAHEATGDRDVDLVVGFCRSVLASSDDQQALRERVVGRFGQDGLTAIAFTLNGTRLYPMLKAVLGYGMCYPSVQVGSKTVALHASSSSSTNLEGMSSNASHLNTAGLSAADPVQV